MTLYRVNDQVRTRLKHPLGQLIVGKPEKTIPKLSEIIKQNIPPKVIAVGDAVSLGMKNYGLAASIYVIDRKTMRVNVAQTINELKEIVVQNPAGQVTEKASEGLRQALKEKEPVVVLVEGEEDLLALPLVLFAPIGSVIIYGQPNVGLVIIRVTPSSRHDVEELLGAMRV